MNEKGSTPGIGECRMKRDINIFGIELTGLTAKEAMKQVMDFMTGETVSTVEIVTMEMLVRGQDDAVWKEQLQKLDLLIPGESEILKAVGADERELVKDLENHTFIRMLLKYFQKNKKRIFLVAGSEEDLAGLKASLNLYCKGLIIAGKAVLPDDINLAESVINEINGVDMDCVLSVLPAQKEASFITSSRALLDARLWIGGGSFLLQKSEKPKASGKVRQFLLKRIFRYRVEKQNQESKND